MKQTRNHRLASLMAALLLSVFCHAQQQADTLWLDARATSGMHSGKQTFSNAIDALNEVNRLDKAVLMVTPGVYWLDNPDDPSIRREADESVPFAFRIRCSDLRIVGTDTVADHTIFAVNRGQTQGAIGNYTMLHFGGKRFSAANVTFGNYCNVDLNYRPDPSLSRPRRGKAIVQAQIAICQPEAVTSFDNCRFISRLNLCPFVGARHSYFRRCYFECTDDALNGAAIYDQCRFTFYSSKPFYSTSLTGAYFVDCDIYTHCQGKQYLTKAGGPVTMIDTRWQGDDPSLNFEWSKGDEPYVCYTVGTTYNGKPLQIDSGRPWRTSLPPAVPHRYLSLHPRSAEASDGDTLTFHSTLHWADADGYHTSKGPDTTLVVHHQSYQDTLQQLSLTTPQGYKGVAQVCVKGKRTPAPAFTELPRLQWDASRQAVSVRYKLNRYDEADASLLTWMRLTPTGDTIPLCHTSAKDDGRHTCYTPTPADCGCTLVAMVQPRCLYSQPGEPASARLELPHNAVPACSTTAEPYTLSTDFSEVICINQPSLSACDAWMMDINKPNDVAQYKWYEVDERTTPAWRYGTAPDGATGTGLVTNVKGARLCYTPTLAKADTLTLQLVVALCKTGGQGFGSATGQYFDIGIGFDLATQSGYSVRIERTPDFDSAVTFTLMQHTHGHSRALTAPVAANCFRTNCHLTLQLTPIGLSAQAYCDMPRPASGTAVGTTVSLHAPLGRTSTRGVSVSLQHTGSAGASSLMLKRLHYRVTTSISEK